MNILEEPERPAKFEYLYKGIKEYACRRYIVVPCLICVIQIFEGS